MAREGGDPCPQIIGGGEIYRQALEQVTEIHLTQIPIQTPGDTFSELDGRIGTSSMNAQVEGRGPFPPPQTKTASLEAKRNTGFCTTPASESQNR